ncbi:unnamed protein product [Linum tenue]|uniref:Uncharacterized protein n=1 Tax=Linum tenue TaxID=586396 RepID=A0AAV0HM88_9ROSI|nr:unnamed protein product [Linum tenue]
MSCVVHQSRSAQAAGERGHEQNTIEDIAITGLLLRRCNSDYGPSSCCYMLAGGTLQPIEEAAERLFPWLPYDQLYFFSCGLTIPPPSIFPLQFLIALLASG